jgi:hypothetical protein
LAYAAGSNLPGLIIPVTALAQQEKLQEELK